MKEAHSYRPPTSIRRFQPFVDERRKHPGEDLLSSLATVELEGERLSDEEIFSFLRLLFPAGADTTYRGLGSMLYGVRSNRKGFDAVRHDAAIIPKVVQESLRWEAPTALLPRFAPKDVTWAGVSIPAGSQVLFGITSGNRDARVFREADRFDQRGKGDHRIFGQQHECQFQWLVRRIRQFGHAQIRR